MVDKTNKTDKDSEMTSYRPYVLQSLYDWIEDNKKTPYIQVNTRFPGVMVPEDYIDPRSGRIVLNINRDAISDLRIEQHRVTFYARFKGVAHLIQLPMFSIEAIYAQENGYGMRFEVEPYVSEETKYKVTPSLAKTAHLESSEPNDDNTDGDDDGGGSGKKTKGFRHLQIVK